MRRRIPWLACVLAIGAQAGEHSVWPEGEGREIAERACSQCHDPVVITASRLSAGQWSARVDAMLAKGAKVGDDEIDPLIEYLATHFGPASPR